MGRGTWATAAPRGVTTATAAPPQAQRRCACGGTVGPSGECAQCQARRIGSSRSAAPTRRAQSATTMHRLEGMGIAASASASSSTLTPPGGSQQQTETANGDGGGAPYTPGPSAGPISSADCGVNGSFKNIPAGTIPATLVGNQLGASFDMIGDYTATGGNGCTCSCGEYRQYVKGSFKANGRTVAHDLCGTPLSPTSFNEDCATAGGVNYRYGYRTHRWVNSHFDNPDQASGCRFTGWDSPGITGSSGDTLEVDLEFMASLIDTCQGKTIAGSGWSVVGSATVP